MRVSDIHLRATMSRYRTKLFCSAVAIVGSWCCCQTDMNDEDKERDEPSYFAYSATLRISGTIPDLNEVTQKLGLAPTHTHRRGEQCGSLAKPYEHDMWMYETPVAETEPLHVHIDALWTSIRTRKECLLRMKQDVTVDVFLGYRSSSDTAGIEIPYQSLEIFRELQVPFGLSIVVT
jgi:hypothetical protein